MKISRRWPLASKAYIGVALLCALTACGLTRGYAARLDAARPDPGPLVNVVVATAPVTRGSPVTGVDVRSIPEKYSPAGALVRPEQATGRVALTDIAAGEVITSNRVAAPRSGPVAALVPPGLRAVTIPVDVPAGALQDGDRVDVLATYGGDRTHVETVAQSLEVLSVIETGTGADALAPGAVDGGIQLVLLVSPETAEQLAYAGAFATLSVSIEPAPAASPPPPG